MTAETDIGMGDFDYEFLDAPTDEQTTEVPEISKEVDTTDFVEEAEETPRAKKYRKIVSRGLGYFWRPMISTPQGIHDGAAILVYGPDIAKNAGKLADTNATFRKVIDFVSEGTENGILDMAVAVIPLAIQLMRNHEDSMQPTVKPIRIPGTQRFIQFKLGIRLGKLRNLSVAPDYMTNQVFSNQALVDKLNKQGIKVAWSNSNNDSTQANGQRRWGFGKRENSTG